MWNGEGSLPSDYGATSMVTSYGPAWMALGPPTLGAFDTGYGAAGDRFGCQGKSADYWKERSKYAIKIMWTYPVFTKERVAWEKKANDYSKRAERCGVAVKSPTGSKTLAALEKASKTASKTAAKKTLLVPEAPAAADAPSGMIPEAPASAGMSTSTMLGIGIAVVALAGGAYYYAKKKKPAGSGGV